MTFKETMLHTKADAEALDRDDPLAGYRTAFSLPDGVIYLDGNSLGPAPIAALNRIGDVVQKEWATDLIRSWNSAGWFEMPYRIGDKIARLIGAAAGEVVVTDTVTTNLFKLLSAALDLRPDRRVILMEGSGFPTDNYIAQGLAADRGQGYEVRFCEYDQIEDMLDESVAVLCLSEVHYKTGRVLDMRAITAKAHAVGALTVWDLCHSAGAMPVDLNGAGADFAVGCSYKYLNGGPGGPAFLFVAGRHQNQASQPLTGWWGHAEPFAFARDYQRADGIAHFLTSTQPIVSMALVEAGIDAFDGVDLDVLRRKSQALTALFIDLVEAFSAGHGFALASPRDADERGSQVSFHHESGYAIMKALIARGVIGDFRSPDIVRFGFAPLYTRYMDVWNAAAILRDIMLSGEWKQPAYQLRDAVT